jgi:hypothetical protein
MPNLQTLLSAVLSVIPHTTWDGERIQIYIPAIKQTIQINPRHILQYQFVPDHSGGTAIMLQMDTIPPSRFIIAKDDLVFEPDKTAGDGFGFQDDNEIELTVTNLPDLISYSEMVRDIEWLEANVEKHENIGETFGSLVQSHYALKGAKRVGIDVSELMARWENLKEQF